MNKLKNFGRLIKYEFIRLFRNKVVVTLLLLFAIFLLLVLSTTTSIGSSMDKLKISIYTSGSEISEISAMSIIEEKFDEDNFIFVNSIDEGIETIKYNKAIFFIEVNNETEPETLIVHYDAYSNASTMLKDRLNNEKNEYSYETIKNLLEDWGVTLKKAYFEGISFKSINADTWTSSSLFVFGISAGLGIVLMFGLAYSISRDNETNVNKMLAYMPINNHTFLWSKIITYLIVGVGEMLFLLLLGMLLFDIHLKINIILLLFISTFYIISTIMLGLVFTSFKSQIATALCSVAVIIIPLILLITYMPQGFNLPIQIGLYSMPMTPFVSLLHGMTFNGVVNWIYIVILSCQSIIYYFIAYLLLRRNIKHN